MMFLEQRYSAAGKTVRLWLKLRQKMDSVPEQLAEVHQNVIK